MRTAVEEVQAVRYMLRCLGVKVKHASLICGDNMGGIQNCKSLVASTSLCGPCQSYLSWISRMFSYSLVLVASTGISSKENSFLLFSTK